MYKSRLVVYDGNTQKYVLSSGVPGASYAIRSVRYVAGVNDSTNISIGSACSAYIEAEIWSPGTVSNKFIIKAGYKLVFSASEDDGKTYTQIGVFYADKPTRASSNVYKVTAYDAVSKLDKDASPWLFKQKSDFTPASLLATASSKCGVTINTTGLQFLSFAVKKFYADNISWRQIVKWVAQMNGMFVYADASGTIRFAWYASKGTVIGYSQNAINVQLQDGTLYTKLQQLYQVGVNATYAYMQSGLSYEDYETALIDGVRITQTDDDMGILSPTTLDAENRNVYVLQGNYLLLVNDNASSVQSVANSLAAKFVAKPAMQYRPCKIKLQAMFGVKPGEILYVIDPNGVEFKTLAMTVTVDPSGTTVECTGDIDLNSGTQYSTESKLSNLDGKYLNVKANADGLRVEAGNLSGQMTTLSTKVDGFNVTVQKAKEDAITESKSYIAVQLKEIQFGVTDSDGVSTFTIWGGGVRTQSASINLQGLVSFESLRGSGKSVINGANITTGSISSSDAEIVADYDAKEQYYAAASLYLSKLKERERRGTEFVSYGVDFATGAKGECDTDYKGQYRPINEAIEIQTEWVAKKRIAKDKAANKVSSYGPMILDLQNGYLKTTAHGSTLNDNYTKVGGLSFDIYMGKRHLAYLGRTGKTNDSDDNDGVLKLGGNIDTSSGCRVILNGTDGTLTLKQKSGESGSGRVICHAVESDHVDTGMINDCTVTWKEISVQTPDGVKKYNFLVES